MTIRALIIGINYSHRSFSLKHAESDAQKFKSYLLQTYPQAQITFLTGDQTTRQEILEQFQALVTATQPSDKFIFYFSGHGTHVFDQSGDEEDSQDEAILAWDSPNFTEVKYLITDDQFREMLQKLPEGTQFRAVIDACHSGTLLDLDGSLEPVPGAKGNLAIFVPNKKAKGSSYDGILLSSSKDSQKSYEDFRGGLLTAALVQYNPRENVIELLKSLQKQISDQTPVLSATSANDLWILFP